MARSTPATATGAWTGAGINKRQRRSGGALSTNIHKTALGFAEASTLGTVLCRHALDGTDVIVAYALAGDANLDGRINTMDFTMLASHLTPAPLYGRAGISILMGKVNALDFSMPSRPTLSATFTSPPVLTGVLVPEPTTLLVATAGLMPCVGVGGDCCSADVVCRSLAMA